MDEIYHHAHAYKKPDGQSVCLCDHTLCVRERETLFFDSLLSHF